MPQMTLETIRALLVDMNLSKVAENAGCSYDALVRLANGDTKSPSYDLVLRVGNYLQTRLDAIKDHAQ